MPWVLVTLRLPRINAQHWLFVARVSQGLFRSRLSRRNKLMKSLSKSRRFIRIICNLWMGFIRIWLIIVFWRLKGKRNGPVILSCFWLMMIRWLWLFFWEFLPRKSDLILLILISLMMDLMRRKKRKLSNMILLLWT